MIRFASILLLLFIVTPAQATEAGWALLREGGHIVLLRHAITPGTGEPSNFDIENCATQRNLADRGRQQARKMGALFLARAEFTEKVLTSRFCNCRETARLVFGERIVEPFAPLDRLSTDAAASEAQNAAVIEEVRSFSGSGNLVMITHLENIVALTGSSAREGEAIIVRAEGERLHILGRIVFN